MFQNKICVKVFTSIFIYALFQSNCFAQNKGSSKLDEIGFQLMADQYETTLDVENYFYLLANNIEKEKNLKKLLSATDSFSKNILKIEKKGFDEFSDENKKRLTELFTEVKTSWKEIDSLTKKIKPQGKVNSKTLEFINKQNEYVNQRMNLIYDTYYTQARTSNFEKIREFREFQLVLFKTRQLCNKLENYSLKIMSNIAPTDNKLNLLDNMVSMEINLENILNEYRDDYLLLPPSIQDKHESRIQRTWDKYSKAISEFLETPPTQNAKLINRIVFYKDKLRTELNSYNQALSENLKVMQKRIEERSY